jgi:transcription termination/antitermination protein NusG
MYNQKAINPFGWYVIHTCSRHEDKVQAGLRLKGLETFLPKITVRSRRRDRFKLLEAPLFPGYLFVHTALSDFTYYHIVRNEGVVRILGNKGECTQVPEETVSSIRKLLQSGCPVYPWQRLSPGKRVRVVDGPFKGVTGVVIRRKEGKQRLVVGVELLGQSVSVELAEETLEPYT